MRFFWFTAEMKTSSIQKKSVGKSGFDYIAMGHIHKPQQVIPGLAAYAGALEPTDKNDTGKHGFIREISEEALDLNLYHWQKREYPHLKWETESRMEICGTDAGDRGQIQSMEKNLQIILTGKRGSGY